MPRDAALVTDAAQGAARQTLDDYAALVAAHLAGGWEQHSQFVVSNTPYDTGIGAQKAGRISSYRITAGLTDNGVATPVYLPAIFAGLAPVTGLPVISLQPVSMHVNTGDRFTLVSYAYSPTPAAYQWSLNGAPIAGATSSDYTVPSASSADAGTYMVSASNQNGSTQSQPAIVTVS